MANARLRRLLSSSILVAVGLAVAQALSYALNLVAARVLGPEQFGAFGALTGLMLITGTVALGLQATVSRRIVASSADERASAGWGLLAFGGRTALIVTLIVALLSPLLNTFLRLDSLPLVLVTALVVGAFTVGGAQLGIVQGAESFGRLGGMYAVMQLCRTAGAVSGALAARSLGATVVGLLAGTIAGLLIAQLIASALLKRPGTPPTAMARETWHAVHALLALFVLTNLDVLLARYFLPAADAGLYAVGVLVAKVAFFLPQFVIVIAFPAMARRQDRRSVLVAAAITACFGLVVTAGVLALSPLVVNLVGGSQYHALDPVAWLFAAEGSLFAVAQVLLYGQVAKGSTSAALFLWGAAAVLLGAVTVGPHSSVQQIVTVVLAVATTVVAIGVAYTALAPDSEPLTLDEVEEFLEP